MNDERGGFMDNVIGDKIKTLRQHINMTQEELGDKIGVTKATINKYETGIITNLRRPIIEKLAMALDTTPSYLMGWAESELNTGPIGTNNGVIGQNSGAINISQKSSKEEKELLRIFNSLSVKSRNKLINYAWSLEENEPN